MTFRNLRIRLSFAAVVIAVAAVQAPAFGQEIELRAQVRHWLELTCGVGDNSAQPISLQGLGSNAVPVFVEAFDSGPETRTIDQVRAAAARRHERIEEILGEGKSFGLSQTDLVILRQTQRGEFVGQAVSDFTFTYGDAALRAVSMLGGTEGRRFLQRVADDGASGHADTARALLRGLPG